MLDPGPPAVAIMDQKTPGGGAARATAASVRSILRDDKDPMDYNMTDCSGADLTTHSRPQMIAYLPPLTDDMLRLLDQATAILAPPRPQETGSKSKQSGARNHS